MVFEAFFDIVNSIVRITTENDASYFEKHGVLPEPLFCVIDRDFLGKFEENRRSKKSLDYYARLKDAFEDAKNTKTDC